MKRLASKKILIYNPETGVHDTVDMMRGESAYEAAVRLGYTTLSEAEWLSEYEVKRDDAISAIIEKGNETLDSIPDDYQTLDTHVTQLATAMPQTHNEYKSHMFLEQADIDETLTEQGKLADAKVVGDKINELSQDIVNLQNDVIANRVECHTEIGRVFLSGGNITFDDTATTFANAFAELEGHKEYTIRISDGYKMFGVLVTSGDTTAYTESSFLGSAWITGPASVKVTTTPTWKYFRCSIQKSDGSTIDKTNGIIAVEYNTKSIFALKNDVEDLSAAIEKVSENEKTFYFNLGRLAYAGDAFSFDPSQTAFCGTSAIDVSDLNNIKIDIADGWSLICWMCETDKTQTRAEIPMSTWVSGPNTIDIAKRYDYMRLGVQKLNGAATQEEANAAVRVYSKNETGLAKEVEAVKAETALTAMKTFNPSPENPCVLYAADTNSGAHPIVNAVAYNDGVIIAGRSNGKLVRIGYTGGEEELLVLSATGTDWRGLYIDSNGNVFASPHASWGSIDMESRGLYKLAKGDNAFVKVLSFDNSTEHDETIWTMCEDDAGYLYAGVYGHTKRYNPRIYRSTDGGDTWSVIVDFTDGAIISNGHHIHSIIYSRWQDALYCIVGEINTVLKSKDHGVTWENLNVKLYDKGSAMCATPNGIVIGSDSAYNCDIDILYNDDKTHERVWHGFANTVFAIRCSDITGYLYAFTKIDSSVNNTHYYPPVDAVTDPSALNAWKNTVNLNQYGAWLDYHNSVRDRFPDGAIRPHHYTILISKDGGAHWEILKKWECGYTSASGFWTIGYFKNGECLAGRYVDGTIVKPVVISEGKHNYKNGGCNLDGEIFVRTCSDPVVTVM